MKTIFFILISFFYPQATQASCTISNEELFEIVTAGSFHDLKFQIESGCSYKTVNSDGDSLFVVARRFSKTENLNYLCSLSHEQFICSGFNSSLNNELQTAVKLQKFDDVKKLLNSGANPDGNHSQNKLHDSNMTEFPLLTAVNKKDYKVMGLLLSAGAQANFSSGYASSYLNTMNSPIMSTVFSNDIEMAKFLISKKIDFFSNINAFNNPIQWIANLNADRAEFLSFLLQIASNDVKKSIVLKILPLMWKQELIREKYFNVLLNHISNAEIQNQNDHPITYVQAALNLKSYSSLKQVLERGAHVDIPSSRCHTGWGSGSCFYGEEALPVASVYALQLDESFLSLLQKHNAEMNPVFLNSKLNLLSYLIYNGV